MEPIIILGTGLAGYTLAKEFRKLNTERPLQIITADDGRFYSKPMLSNALNRGKTADQLAGATAAHMAEQLSADIETLTEVISLDRKHKTVHAHGKAYRYSRLVLAIGADPIKLQFEGNGADDVMSINDLNDYAVFRDRLEDRQHVMILGAGLIGCEFANDLLVSGHRATIVDPSSHALGRLLPPPCAENLEQALGDLGIHWHLNKTARQIDKTSSGFQITLSDDTQLEADLVLSAVGLRPRIQLAAQSGLACNRGIQVNRYLSTSDADVFALGDCAEVEGLVLPFVMPIMHAARALARTLAGENTMVRYPAMPVVVKTPACPTVVAPPASGMSGQWDIESINESSTKARYIDDNGRLLGFALTGDAVSDKQSLTSILPAVLG